MATIDIPDDIILPEYKGEDMTKFVQEYNSILNDYFVQLRQTLLEIESKL